MSMRGCHRGEMCKVLVMGTIVEWGREEKRGVWKKHQTQKNTPHKCQLLRRAAHPLTPITGS